MCKLIAIMQDESGATAIEYALIAGLVSIAALVAITTIGNQLSTTFSTVASDVGR